MLVVEPVQAAIWHCLNHYAYSDATFLAERLMAECATDEAVFLVATCYYRQGKVEQAHHLLAKEGANSPSAKYLMVKCCTDLKKDSEAESLIRGALVDPRKDLQLEDVVSSFGDKAVFALQLLSKICRRSERHSKATDLDKKALSLNPLVWSSFDSLCSAGENVDPNIIWDSESVESLDHITGTNPIVNLINNTTSLSNPGSGTPAPHVFVPPTPVRVPVNKLSTPQPAPAPPTMTVDSPAVETPLLYCNTISSTPLHSVNSPGQMSGISTLNITADSDINQSQIKMPGFLPPPLRPKTKRLWLNKQSYNSFGSFSPHYVGGTPSPAPAGVAAKLLEFSSPQIVLLSPQTPAPLTPAPPPVLPLKSSLSSTPGIPPLRSSTPGAPRVAMAAKPDNTVKQQVVLGQTNMITPSPVNLPTRRSSRLFGSTQSVKENSKTGPAKGRVKTKTRFKSEKGMSENELNEINSRDSLKPDKEKMSSLIESDVKPQLKFSENQQNVNLMLNTEATKLQKSSLGALLGLLKQFGAAYNKMCQYSCREAIKMFESLPPSHATSNIVSTFLGKCYFELNDWKTSVKYFEEVRASDPYRLEMLEYLSTALWHLGQDVSLSALAQDLQNIDKLSPVTWCAAGNCFSQMKEHENAIKFFQRAVQVSSNFAYAYTLLGHEYVAIEELEKALSCFRTAVRIEPRHYNAWYGIGLTYYKQERYQLTDIYYKRALSINRYSPILMCHVAVVQHENGNSELALETLNRALVIAPKNVLCKFQRANILFILERYQEALEELTELKRMVPTESSVYFLIAKVHTKLGNTHLALMNYSWSTDLDPKGANSQIKDALDPALNRHASELGNHTDDQLEPVHVGEHIDEAGPSNQGHQDFQGDISEQFVPMMGENAEAVTPMVVREEDAVETAAVAAPHYMMNDSDDSL